MKIRIDIDNKADELEVIIRCQKVDDEVARLHSAMLNALVDDSRLRLAQGDMDYYIEPEEILFFETEGKHIYAHTKDEVFEAKMRLYELEELLPRSFLRISKSAIVGTGAIYAIDKNPVGPSTIHFRDSHKKLSVSRQYFKILRDKLNKE